jgi:hypothetical protein
MTQFNLLSESRYDEQHADPEADRDPPEVRELDALLAKGWHVMGASYKVRGDWKMNALPVVRETRVVLYNKALGQKVYGFGGDFEDAFSDALAQIK